MADAIKILEEAISDVGYWLWWTVQENGCQLEFAGTQIWNAPESEDQPPSGIIALRYTGNVFLSFLTRNGSEEYSEHWFDRLQRDEMEPLRLSPDEFFLNNREGFLSVVKQAGETQLIRGTAIGDASIPPITNTIAFYAGQFGVIAGGNELRIFSHQGEIKIQEIPDMVKHKLHIFLFLQKSDDFRILAGK